MKIELKNIRIADAFSKETTAYIADLYINDIKAARAHNSGSGGADVYDATTLPNRELITAAEEYCKTLPHVPMTLGDEIFNVPSTLETFVHGLLHAFLCDKDKQKFRRQMLKDMQKSILIGNDEGYTCYNFRKPLAEIIKFHASPVLWINQRLQELAPKMKEGERILNENFPQGVVIPAPIHQAAGSGQMG